MADLIKVEHGNGDVSFGFEDDGTYIPLASVSAARIKHYQDRAHDLGKRLETGTDQAAQDANDALPISAKGSSKSGAKGSGS